MKKLVKLNAARARARAIRRGDSRISPWLAPRVYAEASRVMSDQETDIYSGIVPSVLCLIDRDARTPVALFDPDNPPLLLLDSLDKGFGIEELLSWRVATPHGAGCGNCGRAFLGPVLRMCGACEVDHACAGWLGLCCECGARAAVIVRDEGLSLLSIHWGEIARIKRAESLHRWVTEAKQSFIKKAARKEASG